MSTSSKINIKSLPQTLEIADGDFLVVEKSDGTYILDYADVVLETGKTAITTQVDENTTAIADLSSTMETRVADLSAQLYSDMKRVYIGRATLTIGSGSQGSTNLTPRPGDDVPVLLVSDFIVTPANAAACKYPGFVSYVENFEDQRGFFTVDANITKAVYSVAVSDVSTLFSSSINTSTGTLKVSAFTISELINALQVVNTDVKDGEYVVQAETINTTVEDVLEYPQYYITAIKEY